MEGQKNANANVNAKNAHHPNVTSSDCFFCPNKSPKHKDSSFIFMNDTEKQQILTFKTLNQQVYFKSFI